MAEFVNFFARQAVIPESKIDKRESLSFVPLLRSGLWLVKASFLI
jgi:hypothetical protein